MSAQASEGALCQRLIVGTSLHRSELEFRRLLEKLPVAAYTCDAEGLITYFNRRAIELWGRAPKLNHPEDRFCGSFKLFSPEGTSIPHNQCWMALALQCNTEYNGHEIVIERPDGCRLTALAHANPIQDDSGTLLGAVNVLVDISGRRQAENALREADRSKDEFLATLAHELRNPLAPIRNAVQFLHLQRPPNPEWQWALDVIDRQTQQMTRLVDDLLDLSRITRNKVELRKAPVELAEIVRATLETSQPLIEADGHELTVNLPLGPIYLHADSTRLAQALANLLNNAAKFTARGGHIWLTAEPRGGDAVVTVRDTGVGISADALPYIFDMFTQADSSMARSQGGLGIGLWLVQQLVVMHGGTVQAHSDGPGKGSEFIVSLPVITESSQASPKADPESERTVPATSLRVLVVDDNRDSAEGLGMLLQIRGNDVRTAHDGLEAVTVASEFRPDVVVLDIGLPTMNGYDVAQAIRRQTWGKQPVLIALTGWGQEKDKLRSKAAGFDYHLIKPVDLAQLMQLLASLQQTGSDRRRVA